MKTLWDFMPHFWQRLFASSIPQEASTGPRTVSFADAARGRHALFLGGTGAGKSRCFESIVVMDTLRRIKGLSDRGLMVIDVHGDLTQNLRSRLALMALEYPELHEMVYLIDPANPNWSVRYN